MSTLNPLTERLNIYPVIQAPMAGISTPQLAAAVSNAGGLGSISIGGSTMVQARQLIQETFKLTARPFNVNVFCHSPALRNAEREAKWLHYLEPLFTECGVEAPSSLSEIYKSFLDDDEALELLLAERPEVVSFHFGLPCSAHVRALRKAGIYLLATATNPREASLIEQAGIDAIVAQGIEAGGHRGMFEPEVTDESLSTLVLVRLLAKRTKLPVIAAGGIMDGQSIKAALGLEAAAAQLGTAFILCPESAANVSYRTNLKSPRAGHTRLTTGLSGRPARGMLNRLIEYVEAENRPPFPAYPVAYDAAKRLNAAALQLDNYEFAAQWAGQGAPLARELPAAQLVKLLLEEMEPL